MDLIEGGVVHGVRVIAQPQINGKTGNRARPYAAQIRDVTPMGMTAKNPLNLAMGLQDPDKFLHAFTVNELKGKLRSRDVEWRVVHENSRWNVRCFAQGFVDGVYALIAQITKSLPFFMEGVDTDQPD